MRLSRFPSLVDDITVRLIAGVVLLVGVVALGTQQWWLYAVLAADFSLRSTLGPDASPVAQFVRRALRPRIAASPRPTAGPPKRFAAAIGAVMTGAATVLWLWGAATGSSSAQAAVVAIGVVMVVFPALESLFGICVGCILFSGLMRVGLVPEDICVECADITKRAAARSAARPAA
jgi:hypothetical protein